MAPRQSSNSANRNLAPAPTTIDNHADEIDEELAHPADPSTEQLIRDVLNRRNRHPVQEYQRRADQAYEAPAFDPSQQEPQPRRRRADNPLTRGLNRVLPEPAKQAMEHPTLGGLLIGVVVAVSIILVIFFGIKWTSDSLNEIRDTWEYGYPRTTRMDAELRLPGEGPNLPSYIIGENLYGQPSLLILQASDPMKVIPVVLPPSFSESNDKQPVLLDVEDFNGDGLIDIAATVGGSTNIVLRRPDTNGVVTYSLAQPGELVVQQQPAKSGRR